MQKPGSFSSACPDCGWRGRSVDDVAAAFKAANEHARACRKPQPWKPLHDAARPAFLDYGAWTPDRD